MEAAIIAENKHKYHQTEDTCPFMKHPLNNHFGNLGVGPLTEDVLEGKYTHPSNISDQTRDYILLCKIPKGELVINPLTRDLGYFNDS